jgi:hypothetical protein
MNEAEDRSSGALAGRGHSGGGLGEQSPLQTRAPFLKNWSWQLVVSYNSRACARGGAQHGLNSEAGSTCQSRWEKEHTQEQSLIETFDLLRLFHRSAPFLFFNGNTFADIARGLSDTLFADLPPLRRRELVSAVAHYVAGVLDRDAMIESVESLCLAASFQPGDHVQTLRGTTRGVVVRLLEDGRVVWRPEGALSELTGLPESLQRL